MIHPTPGPRSRPARSEDTNGIRVRPGSRVAQHRRHQAVVRPVHRRRVRRRARQELQDDQPGHRGGAGRGRRGRPGRRRRRGEGRPPGVLPHVGPDVRPRAGQVPLPDRPDHPGARPRAGRAGVDRQRQADQGVARRRRPAGRRQLLLLRRLGRQARALRLRQHAARRRRPGHPVELPAADAVVEDRPGAGVRQHRRAEAGRDHAADARCSSPRSASRPTCRPASSTS